MFIRPYGGTDHRIYETASEFCECNPGMSIQRDWRDSVEGDWVMADDGRVCQVLSVVKFVTKQGQKVHMVRNAFKAYNASASTKMDCDPEKHKSGVRPGCACDRPPKNWEIVMAGLISEGWSPLEAYIQVKPNVRRDSPYTKIYSMKVAASERMQKLIKQKVREAAGRLDIDEEWILSKLKDIVEKNLDSENSRVKSIALEAVKEIKDCLDMKPETEHKIKFGRRIGATSGAIADAEFDEIAGEIDGNRQKQLAGDMRSVSEDDMKPADDMQVD